MSQRGAKGCEASLGTIVSKLSAFPASTYRVGGSARDSARHGSRVSSVALALRGCRRYPQAMGQRVVRVLSVSAWLALLGACGASHFVQRGADLYGEGRFVEADEVFERSEPRVARAPLEERAAYAAYRGATFVALGDLTHAQHWLTVASDIERARPGTMRTEERAFLDGAWQALSHRLSQTPPAPVTTAIASSSQAPSPNVESAPANASPAAQQRSLVPQ
jgi:hypothetical protein